MRPIPTPQELPDLYARFDYDPNHAKPSQAYIDAVTPGHVKTISLTAGE